jgi:hypothetical protein
MHKGPHRQGRTAGKKLDTSNKCQIREGSYTDWVTVRARRGDKLVLELEDDRLEKVTTTYLGVRFGLGFELLAKKCHSPLAHPPICTRCLCG